jgi:xanthine dehydrogenase YagR molybdenum-binding subunit
MCLQRSAAEFRRPQIPRGDAEQAFADAPVKISRDYPDQPEHHNPMEMFGTTCVREGDGG